MNRQEANALLTAIAAGDNRSTSDDAVEYWRGLLADIRIEDALEALAVHRRESTEWLQPAHIRRIVKANRQLRLVASNVVHEPDAADSIEVDRRKRLALVRRAADGQLGPQPIRLALTAAEQPAEVPDLVAARVEAARAARGPLADRCPFCGAAAGDWCTVGRGRRRGFVHPARRAAHGPGPGGAA